MATFILHGGRTSQQHPQNDIFFSQFTKLVDKESVTILLCYFAREKEKWDAIIQRDTENIKKTTNKSINFIIAQNPNDLLNKTSVSDVLYVAGGDAELIEPVYKDLIDLKEQLKGKVYAGSSMGVFLASEQYVLSLDDQDEDTVHKGLGLLPVQTLCYWNIEKEKEKKLKLLANSSNKPILVLNEFEYALFYK